MIKPAQLELRQQLFTRHSHTQRDQCFRRNAPEITARTLDTESRRVQSVLATEEPAQVYDWQRGEVVLEVLLQDGCEYESDTPLIRDHNSYNVDEVVGSIVEHRVERGGILSGWLQFLPSGDDIVDRTWHRVAGKALRRVSVGYTYSREDYITIAAGETQKVGGRTFTAPEKRSLRIVRRWTLLEVSLVVVPADARAQMRAVGTEAGGGQESGDVNHSRPSRSNSSRTQLMKRFLKFLHSRGLASDVTDIAEAIRWACDSNLSQTAIRSAAEIAEAEEIDFFAEDATPKSRQRSAPKRKKRQRQAVSPSGESLEPEVDVLDDDDDGNQGGGQRSQTQNGQRSRRRGLVDQSPADPGQQQSVAEALRADRERMAAIEDLAADFDGVIPESLVREARIEGWTIERTHTEFLDHMRGRRDLFGGTAPAGQIRGMGDITRDVLKAALLTKSDINITPDDESLQHECMRTLGRHREFNIGWLVNQPSQGELREPS